MENKYQKRILIGGAGSKIRRDDGVGLVILGMLETQNFFCNNNVALLNVGTDSFTLLEAMKQYDAAIIIDAANMGASPGTVKAFTPAQAKIIIKNDALSTHGLGLAEIICLAEKLEIKTKITIIGVQPQDISIGEGLTEAVSKSCPKVLSLIEEFLHNA